MTHVQQEFKVDTVSTLQLLLVLVSLLWGATPLVSIVTTTKLQQTCMPSANKLASAFGACHFMKSIIRKYVRIRSATLARQGTGETEVRAQQRLSCRTLSRTASNGLI